MVCVFLVFFVFFEGILTCFEAVKHAEYSRKRTFF